MTPPNSGEAGEEPAGKPLWGGRFAAGPAPAVMALSTSLDFDRRLWPQDIRATSAHARALERAGILEEEERRSIELALHEAAARLESGEFVFDGADEDIHSALERFLVARLGESGAKIHAGRSRNDLVVTDLRLWLKGEIPRTARGIYELEEALYRQARAHRETVGPGYTHLQRAQPIVLAHHLLAHAFALARDFERFTGAYRRADVSPLGAAAFSGTSLPIDPKSTAADLGFAKVFDNAADAVSDRDFALEFLAAGAILAMHLSRIAEDLVIWTSAEFGFAVLDDAYGTGSSIMPQKKNPDVAELTRAKSARTTANLVHLLGAMKGLPLTYNRDLQEDKEPVFDTADTLRLCLSASAGAVSTLTFDTARLAAAASESFTGATDLAEALVSKGVAFRQAHEAVGRLVASTVAKGKELGELSAEELAAVHEGLTPDLLERLDPRRSVGSRRSHGGTAPERVAEQLARLEEIMDDQERWLSGFGAF